MKSDGLLQSIIDASEIGLFLLDRDRHVLLWNSWMARASGITAEAARGHALTELFPSGSIGKRLLQAMGAALDTGMSSLLSSSLNKTLLPLFKEGGDPGKREALQQIVVIKPLDVEGGGRNCLIQITDITSTASREAILRQQARTMQALAENYRLSEVHIRAIVDNTADAIVTFDEKGVIGTYNPAAEAIFGYNPTEIVSKNIAILMPQLGGTEAGPRDSAAAAGAFMGRRCEIEGVHKTGEAFPLELSVSEMELGGQRLFIAIAHDITERKQAEEELRNQKEWLSTLINAMPDIVCFKDGEGRWLIANDFYLKLFQLSGHDYQGRTAGELSGLTNFYGNFLLNTFDTDQRAWREGVPVTYELTIPLTDGTEQIFDMMKLPLFNGDGSRKGLVVVGRNVTDRKLAAARIQHLAHHDSLTDLPNRALFQERLRQALAQAKRSGTMLALMMLDLDKFKDVNDTLGHHVGDLLLKAVARRLQRCLRESDTVARLGGDEFAVILTNLTDADGAANVAEAIISSIGEPFGLDDNEIVTSTSIGITIYPHDAADADQLLKYADLALYRSKAEGRNNFHFYVAEMDAEVQARKAIERDLRQALGSNQLVLYFQPLVDMRTGRISGSEALIRWIHPVRGFISPGEFIPIAERTDLIIPLGRWVLYRACAQVAAWQREGLGPLRVAVNLSPAQFKHQDMVVMVRDVLDQTGLDPSLLQLEITEGIAMHNVEATIDTLKQLQALGAQISIDDFGTGYSSLNYLKRFPVDKLKIDRSFVTDIGLHPDNAAIVKAIINLGHTIGAKVNVEGVETEEQLDFVRAHGVDEVQGFYFSKPLPADDFRALVSGVLPWQLSALEQSA